MDDHGEKTMNTVGKNFPHYKISQLADGEESVPTDIDRDCTYRVLVCDDDDVDRERISRLLSKLDISTHVDFADTEGALLAYIEESEDAYDCIILDYRLGATDGINLLKKYAEEKHENLPVIMVTGFGDERVAVEAMRLGAYDYLSKNNLSPEMLEVALEGVIRRTALQEMLSKAEEQLLKQSLYDEVTGLANRYLFFDRLEHTINTSGRTNAEFSLLLLDLDRFKQVNDTFGHVAGDVVLSEIGQRLASLSRQADTISRIGGDEFTLLLPELSDPDDIAAYAQNVISAITDPIILDDAVIHMGASIGIATYPAHGVDSNSLYLHVDQALYESKKSARSYTVYDGASTELEAPKAISYSLPQALRNDELFLEFQPKVCLQTGKVTSVESLVRWQHPEHGRIMPGSFLPDAERTGLILNITLLTMRLAATAIVKWRAQGVNLPVAVNVSARVLDNDELPMRLREIVLASGLTCEDFKLEITETALASSRDVSTEVLNELASLGFCLSIDDFGAGFTSFQNIRDTQISEIKIDRIFMQDLEHNRNDVSIVRSISVLAESLGISVVAEGVEREAVMRILKSLGCTHAQGYFIARPMPEDKFIAWLNDYQNNL